MPPKGSNKRYAAYTRTATNDQTAKRSLAAQEAAFARFVQDNGGKIIDTFEDMGFSAHDDQRPAFQQLMYKATHPDKPFDAILVTSHNRLARNSRQWAEYLKLMDKHDVKVISVGRHNIGIQSCYKMQEYKGVHAIRPVQQPGEPRP